MKLSCSVSLTFHLFVCCTSEKTSAEEEEQTVKKIACINHCNCKQVNEKIIKTNLLQNESHKIHSLKFISRFFHYLFLYLSLSLPASTLLFSPVAVVPLLPFHQFASHHFHYDQAYARAIVHTSMKCAWPELMHFSIMLGNPLHSKQTWANHVCCVTVNPFGQQVSRKLNNRLKMFDAIKYNIKLILWYISVENVITSLFSFRYLRAWQCFTTHAM